MALTKIPSSLLDTSSGLDLSGNITLGDNEQILLGDSSDLRLYHDGTNSYIDDNGDGNLTFRTVNQFQFEKFNTELLMELNADGAVNLYYDNSKKFETSSAGATVTGTLTVTGDLDITGNINSYNVTDLDVTDQTITLGAGQTEANSGGSGIIVDGSGASILWDETNTEFDINNNINVTGTITGDGLVIDGDTINFNTSAGDLDIQALGGSSNQIEGSGSIKIKAAGGSVDLINGTTEVLSTTATGINVTGTTVTDALTINTSPSQYLQWNDTASTVLSYYVGSTSITASTTTNIVTFNGGANHYAAYDLTIFSVDGSYPAGLELTRMTILIQSNSTSVTKSAMTIVDQTSAYNSGTGNLAFSISSSGVDLILTVTESDGDARSLRVFVNSEFWSSNRYGGATII